VLEVTIVVATRNRADALGRTLAKLTALPERPEVVVVDNGSTDGTPARVARAFPAVRVVALRHNRGACARNAGVAAAQTPYVAFADDDSWWAPGALRRARQLFDAHPRLGLLAARTVVGPDATLDPMSAFMATAPLGTAPDLPGPSVLGFLACAAVVRRDAFLACGGFDPVVFFMGEEARLAYDLRSAGWGLVYRDDVVAHHHPPGGAPGDDKRALMAGNAVLTAWMRRPVPVALGATARLLRGGWHDRAARRGFRRLAARLPSALAARRPPHPVVEAELARSERDSEVPQR
jgi:GT2 family glycosyltransferase